MKKIGMCFCLLMAASASALADSKNNFGRENVLVWSTRDAMPLVSAAAEKLESKAADVWIEPYNPVLGFRHFCRGLDARHPDMIVVTRNPTEEELDLCREKGVTDVLRVKLGDEVLIFVAEKSANTNALTRKIVWSAFSREVFAREGGASAPVIANPNKKWKDLDSSYSDASIKLIAPDADSYLYGLFNVLGLEAGCRQTDSIKVMKYHRHFRALYRELCWRAREDGVVSYPATKTDSNIDRIAADKSAIGVMSFPEWDKGDDRLKALAVEGVEPTLKTIKNGTYVLVRPHYVFVKKANMKKVKGLEKLVDELSSDAAIGASGYITSMNLVQTATPEQARSSVAISFKKMVTGDDKNTKN